MPLIDTTTHTIVCFLHIGGGGGVGVGVGGDMTAGMCNLFLNATVAAQQLVENKLNGK